MRAIRVLDRRRLHFSDDLRYAAADAQPSWFTGALPLEGRLAAWMCPGCGRVVFYAVPDAGPSEVAPADEPPGEE
jgi:hypothetical protein